MNQDKNTIKEVVFVLLAVVIGEGVLGWGVYWPLLLLLSDREGVFWLSVLVGILISVFSATSIGPASLFMVAILGAVTLFLRVRRGSEWWLILVSLGANIVFDMLFGLSWSIFESIGVLVVSILVFSWEGRGDSISVRYK